MLNGRLVNNLGGITTIKAYVAEDFEIEQVRRESEAYRDANRRAIRLSAAFVPLIRVVILVGFTATLLYGGMEVVDGTLSVGTYSVLVFLTQRLLWPLTRLGETLDQYQRAMASTTRVMNLLDTPFEIHPGDRDLPRAEVRGEVEAARRGLRLRGTARGSSTTSRCASPPAPPSGSSAPRARGRAPSSSSSSASTRWRAAPSPSTASRSASCGWRTSAERCGLVSQDVFLFHGTVRENLVYGSWGAGREEVERAARLAEAHEFIERLPQGYDTVVGRARAEALRRPAPADRPRPRHPQGPADPGAR